MFTETVRSVELSLLIGPNFLESEIDKCMPSGTGDRRMDYVYGIR